MSGKRAMRTTTYDATWSWVTGLVCLALTACSTEPPPPPAQPLCADCNIVLISMDTVRADHLGAYGYGRPTSPNVDKLAARATVFERAVSQSAWTLPAHGSMLTGLYPGRLGLAHYPAKRRLPTTVPTLGEVLQGAGYTTAAFTGGGFVSQHFGFDRGFEVFSSQGRRFEHNVEDTLRWLELNKKRKFFLFFHGYDAHRPYFSRVPDKQALGLPARAPVEKRGFCVRGRRQRPPEDELDTIIRYYDAAIRMGDRNVGRLLDALAKHRLMRRTVILVTSDHGEEFFEHGNCDHVRFLYREVVDVPYILYLPKHRGRRVREVVPASISVPRTLLDIVGVEHSMPGISLEPVLRGKRTSLGAVFSETDSVLGALGSRGASLAMTGERYKLISYTEEGADEAYDLRDDPHEQSVLPETHEAYFWRATLRAFDSAQVPVPAQGSAPRGRTVEVSARSRPTARERRRESSERKKSEAPRGASQPARGKPDHGAEEPSGSRAAPAESSDTDEELELPADVREQLRSLGYVE